MATLSESNIQAIIDEIQMRTTDVLMRSAEQMARLSATETVSLLKRKGYKLTAEQQQALIERVVSARMTKYSAGLQKGGSECVERVLTQMSDGRIKATTGTKFVPWLSDKSAKESESIMRIIREGTIGGKHPYTIAKELKPLLEGSRHNAETIARTEAAKIKSDIRWDTMREQGVKYFKYVTAGDSKVREEHRLRNGKIYKASDCPFLGEYNCRCVLVPADYDVKYEGATVSESEAEYLTKEEAGL